MLKVRTQKELKALNVIKTEKMKEVCFFSPFIEMTKKEMALEGLGPISLNYNPDKHILL